MAPERRLAAILSADVAGYSRLMAEDEQGTIQTIAAYREALSALLDSITAAWSTLPPNPKCISLTMYLSGLR